jgi:trehalose 6-phosphate phosphatase
MPLAPVLTPLAEAPARAAVMLDFDGSLAGIVDDPAAVVPLPEARAALARLVDPVGLVAVVSGRPVAVLERVLDVNGVVLVGQYGLERMEDGQVVVDPRAVPYLDAVAAAADEAERSLPGLLVERKAGIAVTVHWRTAPEREQEAIARTDDLAQRYGLASYATKMARELRPPVPVDKGTAVEALLAPAFDAACFAGDDRGDLPAFAALTRAGLPAVVRIGVRSVEAPAELIEQADVVVDGPSGLAALLGQLADAISAPPR